MSEARLERAHELRRRAETHLISAGWLSARELLEDALDIYQDEAHAAGQAQCLRGLGDAALKLDEPVAAGRYYEQALAAAAGDERERAECLLRMADLLRADGKTGDAKARLVEAAELFRACGHRIGEAQCLGLLGELARQEGAGDDEVLSRFRAAHGLQMEAGDLRGAAVTLTFIANYLKERDPARAAEAFVKAADIYDGLGLGHRAEPFLAAARRLDPAGAPPPRPRRPGPWDSDE